MTFLPVVSLVDSLTEALRTRIIEGELEPGQRVSEANLAEQYDVSRPTAKTAIERLVLEGLMERTAHKSARVPHMYSARITDMYFARKLIECQTYRILAESQSVPADAREAVEQLRTAAVAGPLVGLIESDVHFHRSLVDQLGSTHISRAHTTLTNEMRLCLVQVQANRLLDPMVIASEHEGILRAIEAGDSDLAAELGAAHLDLAETKLMQHLTETTGSGSAPE